MNEGAVEQLYKMTHNDMVAITLFSKMIGLLDVTME